MRTPTLRSNLAFALKDALGQAVTIKVRLFKVTLKGTLTSYDQYSNVFLEDVEESVRGADGNILEKNEYSSVLVRGDSIITIERDNV